MERSSPKQSCWAGGTESVMHACRGSRAHKPTLQPGSRGRSHSAQTGCWLTMVQLANIPLQHGARMTCFQQKTYFFEFWILISSWASHMCYDALKVLDYSRSHSCQFARLSGGERAHVLMVYWVASVFWAQIFNRLLVCIAFAFLCASVLDANHNKERMPWEGHFPSEHLQCSLAFHRLPSAAILSKNLWKPVAQESCVHAKPGGTHLPGQRIWSVHELMARNNSV